MRIGNGWTKTTDKKDTYISTAIDEAILELYPQLKNLNITLWHIKAEDRKSELSPQWTINIKLKKEKTDKEEVQNDEIPM